MEPSYHRGRAHPVCQRAKTVTQTTFTLTVTSMGKLESPINVTPPTEWLGCEAGEYLERTHTDMLTPHRKSRPDGEFKPMNEPSIIQDPPRTFLFYVHILFVAGKSKLCCIPLKFWLLEYLISVRNEYTNPGNSEVERLKCIQSKLLVFSFSLMSGLAALDAKCSSRLGLITVSYYLWTTFVAVIVGIIMVSIIHPGGAAQKEDSEDSGKPIMSSADALLDLIRWD